MPDGDNNFVVSLVSDFRRWRHVQAKNTQFYALVHKGIFKSLSLWPDPSKNGNYFFHTIKLYR